MVPPFYANPPQPGVASVALPDGVRGDEAESAVAAQEMEGAAEEVGDEVGVAVALLVQRLQPIEIAARGCRR